MELEHYPKAKQLLRGFRAGEPEARQRACEALGERAHERFQLGDAQHVVAIEHGYRSWPQLKHALEHAEPDRPVERIGLQPVSFYDERARELTAAAAERRDSAIRRVRARVPRLGDFGGDALDLRDACLVIAREYGFGTWRELVRTVERARAEHEGQREGAPEVRAALEAISRGDVVRLADLLDDHRQLTGLCHNGAWSTLLEAIAQPDVVGDRLGAALGVDPAVVELLISRSDERNRRSRRLERPATLRLSVSSMTGARSYWRSVGADSARPPQRAPLSFPARGSGHRYRPLVGSQRVPATTAAGRLSFTPASGSQTTAPAQMSGSPQDQQRFGDRRGLPLLRIGPCRCIGSEHRSASRRRPRPECREPWALLVYSGIAVI